MFFWHQNIGAGGGGVCYPKFLFGGLHTPLPPCSAVYEVILTSLAICAWTRLEKTKERDSMEMISKLIWNWTGHVARRTGNRWTTRIRFWTPHGHTRNQGRPRMRWRDGLNSFIKPWPRVAQNVRQVNGDGLRPTLLVCEI